MPLEPRIDLPVILLVLGVIQGLFLAFLIFTRPQKLQRGHKFLGLFLLSFSLMSIEDILFETRYILRYPYMINTLTLLIFTLAPSLYFYTKAMTSGSFRFGWKQALHYLPFALIVLLSVPEMLGPNELKLREVQAYYARGDYYFNFSILIPMLQISIYFAVIVRLLVRHRRKIRKSFSYTEGISLRWITTLIALNVVLWLIWSVVFFTRWTKGLDVLSIAYTLSIYSIGYLGIRQKDIFSSERSLPAPDEPTDPGEPAAPARSGKYAKSGLSDEMKKDLSGRLTRLMEEQKPYLDAGLTLPRLATLLEVSVNHLSQIINTELGDNFYNFVNKYRLEEVKKLLADPRKSNYTILALAFEAGFQSKSAFNAFFKKSLGCSPKEFLASRSAR